MLLRKWTALAAGTALIAIGGAAAAQSSADTHMSPPAPPAPPTPPSPPAPPAPPTPPTPPEPPAIDRAEIDREVAEGMEEARAGIAEARKEIAEARKEIAEARKEIMRQKDIPAGARAQALAALDKAERDVENALPRERD